MASNSYPKTEKQSVSRGYRRQQYREEERSRHDDSCEMVEKLHRRWSKILAIFNGTESKVDAAFARRHDGKRVKRTGENRRRGPMFICSFVKSTKISPARHEQRTNEQWTTVEPNVVGRPAKMSLCLLLHSTQPWSASRHGARLYSTFSVSYVCYASYSNSSIPARLSSRRTFSCFAPSILKLVRSPRRSSAICAPSN